MILDYLKSKESILLKTSDSVLKAYYIILYTCDANLYWASTNENKQELCNQLGLTMAAVNNIVTSLKKRELIIPANMKGNYFINKKYLEFKIDD